MSVKVVLVGRPGTVQKEATFVGFTLNSATHQIPPPPKGLPPLKGTTKYLVLAAMKQWDKVEPALNKNKEDKLVIEGYTTIQEGFAGIVVQATSMSTQGLQRARKEEQRGKAQSGQG
jgi:hypothetical protein